VVEERKAGKPVARVSHTLLSQARAILTHRTLVHAGFRQIMRKKCWIGTVFLVKVDAVFKGSKADVSPLKLAFACPSSISADPPLRAVSTIGGIPIYLRRAGDRWRLRERNEQPRSFVTLTSAALPTALLGVFRCRHRSRRRRRDRSPRSGSRQDRFFVFLAGEFVRNGHFSDHFFHATRRRRKRRSQLSIRWQEALAAIS
jgi:hypothetical protein